MAKRYEHFSNAGDEASDGDRPYAWISEWLCEYVDGTMDPSMQAVFEEYMDANPALAEHVERLCDTRTLLGECDNHCQDALARAKERLQQQTGADAGSNAASPDAAAPAAAGHDAHVAEIEARIQQALAEDEADGEAREVPLLVPRSAGAVVAAASAMTLMLGVGLFAGAMLFDDAAPPRAEASVRPAATEQAAPDRPAAVSPRVAASGWAAAPPMPLKKMPTGSTADTSRAASALPLQRTGLNP